MPQIRKGIGHGDDEKMNLHKVAYIMFGLAFLIALAQYVEWGEWFTVSQLHHETFVVAFGFAGGLLLYLDRRNVKTH